MGDRGACFSGWDIQVSILKYSRLFILKCMLYKSIDCEHLLPRHSDIIECIPQVRGAHQPDGHHVHGAARDLYVSPDLMASS